MINLRYAALGLDLSLNLGAVYRNSFIGNDIGLSSSDHFEVCFRERATIERNIAMFNGDGFLITDNGDQLKSNTRSGIAIGASTPQGRRSRRGTGQGAMAPTQRVGVVCH